MKKMMLVLGSVYVLGVAPQAMAFGGFLQGLVENAVKDAATDLAKDTAKSVAAQQGIKGADGIIDGAANVAANGGVQALSTGNPAITAQVAADLALANRQANTPIPAAQLRQFPPSLADLNNDGVVTWGEVQTVQNRNAGNVAFALRNTGSNTAPTHQPADLNKDGTVTDQEIAAYRAAMAQFKGAQLKGAGTQTQQQPAAAPKSSGFGGLGGMLGGLLPSGGSSASSESSSDAFGF